MKKVLSLIAILLVLIVATITPVYAATEILEENNEVLESENASDKNWANAVFKWMTYLYDRL